MSTMGGAMRSLVVVLGEPLDAQASDFDDFDPRIESR